MTPSGGTNGSTNGHNGLNGATGMHGPRKDEGTGIPEYDVVHFREQAEYVIDLVRRRKWLILGICVFVVGAMAAYTFTQEPQYEAESLVIVSESSSMSGDAARYGSMDIFAGTNRSLQNELILLRRSSSLRQAVAERLVEQGVVPGTDRLLRLLQTDDGDLRTVAEVAALLHERGHSIVKFDPEDREADVIRITATSPEPREAAFLADVYMEEYLDMTQRAARSSLTASREFLEGQVKENEEDLRHIEGTIQEYRSREGAVALDEEGRALVERIASVQAERDAAQVQLRMRQTSLATIEQELESISPQLSRRIASGLENEIEALQGQIAELKISKSRILLASDGALSAADSARVEQTERRIRQHELEVERLSEEYVEEVMAVGGARLSTQDGLTHVGELQRQAATERIAITGLEAEIDMLQERLRAHEETLGAIPARSMELAQLERTRSYTEGMFRHLTEQLQETRIREEAELGYADRVTEAIIPIHPVSPRVRLNMMSALLFGLMLGLLVAIGRDRLDNRIYKPDRLREKGYRTVGVVPNMKPFMEEHFGRTEYVEMGQGRLKTSLLAQVQPTSPAAEAYRHIRTNIQFSLPNTTIETLLLTSPGPGDGKSVSASNLAIVMAQAGRKTLLIDADMRRPQGHKLFDVARSPGLSDVLRDGSENGLEVHKTAIRDLLLMPAGSPVGNPAELLGSPELRELLRRAREHFDMVIIDSPPVLAATDSVLLSTQCDATIVVARAGAMTEPELDHAMDALEDVGATVIGTLFNGFDLSMAYGYTTRYRDYGRYGPYGSYTSTPPEEDLRPVSEGATVRFG